MGKQILKYKKIEQSRCPWCGEFFVLAKEKSANREMKVCNHCRRRTKSAINHRNSELIKVVLLCALLYLVYAYNFTIYAPTYGIHMIPSLLYVIMNRNHFPVWRAHEVYDEKELGKASVRWYSLKEGGIGLPHFRLMCNTIFPVCFIDEKGMPVSQTVCVRLKNRSRFFLKNVRITLISDDLWKPNKEGKTPWELAEKFVIFNNGEVVGEGIVKHKDHNI